MKRYLNVVLLAATWAAYYVAASVSNKAVDPLVTGTSIRFITFILLTAVMTVGREIPLLTSPGRALPWLIAIGMCGFMLDITAFIGFKHSTSSIGTVLLKTDIIMVNLVSLVLYKSRLRACDWLYTVLMLYGIYILLGISPFDTNIKLTDILFVASAAFVTANAFLIKHVQTAYGVGDNVIAYYNNFVTMILFAAVSIISGKFSDASAITSDARLAFALGVAGVGQFLIYKLYYRNLRNLPVWVVKSILLLIPVFSAVADAALFGVEITPRQTIGSIMVVVSAALLIVGQRNKIIQKGY